MELAQHHHAYEPLPRCVHGREASSVSCEHGGLLARWAPRRASSKARVAGAARKRRWRAVAAGACARGPYVLLCVHPNIPILPLRTPQPAGGRWRPGLPRPGRRRERRVGSDQQPGRLLHARLQVGRAEAWARSLNRVCFGRAARFGPQRAEGKGAGRTCTAAQMLSGRPCLRVFCITRPPAPARAPPNRPGTGWRRAGW